MDPPNNLPLQLTSFIGREREIADVKRLLGTSRLLTLTGAGGSGKTRLALQAASQVAHEYADGVYFVNLAPITDYNIVVSSIAQTLDVKEASGQPLLDTLKAYLKGKEVLLLLDNFEQVLGAAPLLVDLLVAALDLRVMVTSRESLHLQGEQLYPVLPLELPDLTQQASIEDLSQNEAVALFRERARSVKPDFDLTEDNAPVVAQICSRLDGLPLAIELAAARVRVLTTHAMLSRLENRLSLLTGGAHDLPTRHQTLRNTIGWSYDLLSEGEKQLFRRMAVFQGGRTLEALEMVCNFDSKLSIDILEGVQSLVDKSLLQQRADSSREARFWMLETIHQYAREKLQESGEAEELRRKHTKFFAALAEAAATHWRGPEEGVWLRRLEEEHDNLRAALDWSTAGNGTGETGERVILGLMITHGIKRFWRVRGYLTEGRWRIERVLAAARRLQVRAGAGLGSEVDGANLDILIGWGHLGGGYLAWIQRDQVEARRFGEQVLATARARQHRRLLFESLSLLGLIAETEGDYELAVDLHTESLTVARELGDTLPISNALHNLGVTIQHRGDWARGSDLLREGLSIRTQRGDRLMIAYSQIHLGNGALAQENPATAREYFMGSLPVLLEFQDRKAANEALEGLACVAQAEGEYRRAARLFGAAEVGRHSAGIRLAVFDTGRREVAVATTRTRLGQTAYQQAWAEGLAMSMEQAIAYALESMPETKALARPHATPKQRNENSLSRREVELLRLLAHGLNNQQIAERLFLSTNTVRAHLYSIYSKIDVSNRGAAIRFATDHGLT